MRLVRSPSRAHLSAALAVLALAGCGGDDPVGSDSGPLVWDGDPVRVPAPESLPNDHVVSGIVKNDSLRRVEIVAKDAKLRDADGRELFGGVIFSQAAGGHGIIPPLRPELATEEEQESEDLRLGRRVRVEPRKTAPLTIAWREPKGAKPAVAIDYGRGTLPLP